MTHDSDFISFYQSIVASMMMKSLYKYDFLNISLP